MGWVVWGREWSCEPASAAAAALTLDLRLILKSKHKTIRITTDALTDKAETRCNDDRQGRTRS